MINKEITTSFHTMQGMKEVSLTVTLFDNTIEAVSIMGEKRTLEILNDYVIQRERTNWNNRYTKVLNNRK